MVLISIITPWLYWYLRIRPRQYRLMGRYDEVSPEFKGKWASNICGWIEKKTMCCSLICCLPARMADTWDSMGLINYWNGIRMSLLCCFLYTFGCCLCGASIPGQQRSEIRDFFGFGDKVKGNLELGDYCCYLCCPVCCVIQEAHHVDGALSLLPPPMQDTPAFDWDLSYQEEERDKGGVDETTLALDGV